MTVIEVRTGPSDIYTKFNPCKFPYGRLSGQNPGSRYFRIAGHAAEIRQNETLCGIWTNCKSFLLTPRRRAARVR